MPDPESDRQVPHAGSRRRGVARALAGVAAGNLVEWYDFAVYGYSASTIAKLFFSGSDPVSALLATFALFGVTFLFRPAGGVFFGRLGDRIGRRNTLVVVIVLMGSCTTLIGLLPTYGSIGAAAPMLLALMRLGQGFSSGGEAAGASTFLSEYAPPGRRGTWTAISNSTQVIPFVIAACLIYALEHSLSQERYLAWGWRVPFLLSAPLALGGLALQLKLEDTPVFLALEKTGEIEHAPLAAVLSRYRRELLLLIGIASLNAIGFYMASSYMPTYLSQVVGLDARTSLISNAVALSTYSVLILAFGVAGDRFGRKPIILVAALCLVVVSIPGYLIAARGGLANAIIGQVMVVVPVTAVASVVSVAQCELFPTAVRYTGAALGYNIAYTLFGGTAPFVSQYLVLVTHASRAPAYYLTSAAALALVPIALLPETSRVSMTRGDNRDLESTKDVAPGGSLAPEP
jgi:MHS family proline/betaine transporter-like MFS transporter